MSFRNLRKIALQNLAAYKKHYIKLLCEFVALIFLVSVFAMFSISVTEKQESLLNKNVSSNYIISTSAFSNGTTPNITWSEILKVDDADVLSKMDLEASFLSAVRLNVIVDNNRHTYDGDLGEVQIYSDDEWDIFLETDFEELGTDKNDLSRFLLGRFPQKANEIVVAHAFLQWFGLDESVLNKEITVTSKYDESKVLIRNAVVCGILTEDFCNLSGHNYEFAYYSPAILVHSQSELLTEFASEKIFVGSLDSWPSEKDAEQLLPENTRYAGYSFLQQAVTVGKIQTVLNAVITYVATAIVFALLISIFVSLVKLREAMYQNSAMLLMIGLNHSQLTKTFVIQFAFVFTLSFVLAALFTVCAFFGLNEVLSMIFSVTLSFSFAGFIGVFAIAFFMVCILALLIICFFAQTMYKRS